MEEKEIEVTLLEIKNLYEYFYGAYNRPGLSVDWSLLVAKNIKYLETPYKQISKGVYNEENDPKFYEFKDKYEKLVRKYADRDEQGNMIMENEEPRVTELIVEFNKEKDKLEQNYKNLLDKLNNKNTINNKFLQQKVKIKLNVLKKDNIPALVPPFVVDMMLNR